MSDAWIGGLDAAWAATGLGAGTPAPQVATALRARGHGTVLLAGERIDGRLVHWLDAPQARGWVVPTQTRPADPARLQAAFEAAEATGHPQADAALIACVQASGLVAPRDANDLPQLTWGEGLQVRPQQPSTGPSMDLYAIVDSAERVAQVVAAGVATVQLRIKRPPAPDAAWEAALRLQMDQALQACQAHGATLVVNDHWRLARALGAAAVHLGQDDLLALGDAGRQDLLASGVSLGISSHSLWELCRARALAPRSIACGPVWPTTTKDMPWRPQGLDNLAWWCRVAGAPVTAIGGILEERQVALAASCGADGVCVVRGLGAAPEQVLPGLRAALVHGRSGPRHPAPDWLHPVLSPANSANPQHAA